MTEEPISEFSFDDLQAEDAAPITEPITPDYKASKDRPRSFGSRRNTSGTTGRTNTRTTKEKPKVPNRKGQFIEPLEKVYVTLGLGLMPFDQVCSQAILQSANACAISLDDLAYRNEAVRRTIFALVSTSAVGAVIFAHLPILMAIAMHHVPAFKDSPVAKFTAASNPDIVDADIVSDNVAA